MERPLYNQIHVALQIIKYRNSEILRFLRGGVVNEGSRRAVHWLLQGYLDTCYVWDAPVRIRGK